MFHHQYHHHNFENLEVRSQLVSLLGEVVKRGTEHAHLIIVTIIIVTIINNIHTIHCWLTPFKETGRVKES